VIRFNSFKDDFLNAYSSKSWQARTALRRGRWHTYALQCYMWNFTKK